MDRPLYIVPVRVIAASLGGVFLIGLVAGMVGGRVIVRQALKPGDERVIERVERVTVQAEDALAEAATAVAPSLAAIQDSQERSVGTAVPLTQDGLLLAAGPLPTGALRVRPVNQGAVDATVVRTYPEFQLSFLRATGTFTVPALNRETELVPALLLGAVVPAADGGGHRVRVVAVEAVGVIPEAQAATVPGLATSPILHRPLSASFQGAALVGTDGRVRGLALVLSPETTLVLPASVLDALARDALDHKEPTIVRALEGLDGRWEHERNDGVGSLVFEVAQVAPESRLARAGLRRDDVLTSLDDKPLLGPSPLGLALLAAEREGKLVRLGVRRGTDIVTLSVTATKP